MSRGSIMEAVSITEAAGIIEAAAAGCQPVMKRSRQAWTAAVKRAGDMVKMTEPGAVYMTEAAESGVMYMAEAAEPGAMYMTEAMEVKIAKPWVVQQIRNMTVTEGMEPEATGQATAAVMNRSHDFLFSNEEKECIIMNHERGKE